MSGQDEGRPGTSGLSMPANILVFFAVVVMMALVVSYCSSHTKAVPAPPTVSAVSSSSASS